MYCNYKTNCFQSRFNSLQAMVITYSQTKFQGQQLGSLKDGMETNSRTDDRADYITFLGNAVSN